MIDVQSKVNVIDGTAKGRSGIVTKVREPNSESSLGLVLDEAAYEINLDPQGCGHVARLSASQIELAG